MGGTIADLTMTVGKSIKAFNSHDDRAVKENLADDIIVVSLHPKQTLRGDDGQKNIVGQIVGPKADNPTFTLLHMDIDLDGVADGEATNATITGTAKWKDNKGAETLQFRWECVFKDKWLFHKVSAVVVAPEERKFA